MVEIEFSYIWDHENDHRVWAEFMKEFESLHGVKVCIRPEMTWDTAWAELFSFTSLGKGPHVSHVGNTWINSLARMNVLRPFQATELTAMGGAWDFVTPNWESGILPEDKRVWAIPWTTWIYVICYRKDLLEQVGIDPCQAFGTIKSIRETVLRLTASPLDGSWLNPQVPVSYRDFLHIAASWVWAGGGDFTNKDGTKVIFNSPQALNSLKDWVDIYRPVPAPYKKLNQPQMFDLFRQGHAAAMLANIHGANTFIDDQASPIVRENLGIASMTELPWTGGGSFVIWEHVRKNPEQEQAAVELVTFLASKDINIRYQHETASMPARIDALKEIYPEGNPARDVVMLAATKGRHYYNTTTWRRIEQQLSETLGIIINKTLDNPSTDTDAILHAHLDPLAERLNNTLAG
jgi:multiple sugar transport system substrate-binding protein